MLDVRFGNDGWWSEVGGLGGAIVVRTEVEIGGRLEGWKVDVGCDGGGAVIWCAIVVIGGRGAKTGRRRGLLPGNISCCVVI